MRYSIGVALLMICIGSPLNTLAQKPGLVVPVGHAWTISSVAFSPDGQKVLTGSLDGKAKLWDLSGRLIQTFTGHTDGITAVAFSPGGQKVLTGSRDKTAKLWDLSGREMQTFSGHTAGITSVAFSPDGQNVLTGSEDKVAKLWGLSGGAIKTFQGHAAGITSVAFSPDGQNVLTGSGDKVAKLWGLSGRELQTFAGHTGGVTSVAFSPDGQNVLTGSENGVAKLWDLSGDTIKTFKGHDLKISAVAFSPDGHMVLTGSWDETAQLWNVSGDKMQTFTGHAAGVTAIAFSPDGQMVLTGSWNSVAKLWDLSGRNIQSFAGHAQKITSVAFSPDRQKVLTGNWNATATLWDLPGRAIQTFTGHAVDYLTEITAVAFSPDGQKVLTGSMDKTIQLWDLLGREMQTFSGHAAGITAVAFSPDGQKVLAGSLDKTSQLWDLSGNEIKTFTGHAGEIISVAFSPDGQKVLTGSLDKTIKLWDLSGNEIQTFKGHADGINSVAFSPNGQTVLTGSRDKTAKLWDLSGREMQTLSGHAAEITSVAFSPDGQKILTGSKDNVAKLWDLSGREMQTFAGHDDWVTSVAFSPDGQMVLTGSFDNTAKLWNTNTGQCLATLIAVDSSDWVVTDPTGLFDASPGAMHLLHFVVGKDLDVIELEQLKERYYEPGLLSKVMGFSDEPIREVEGFDSVALYPSVGLQLDTVQNKLHIRLTPRSGGVGKVSVFINDKEIIENANPLPKVPGKMRDTAITIELGKYARYFLLDTLNSVSIRAYNEAGWLKSAAHSVEYRPVFAKSRGQNTDQGAVDERIPKKRKPSLHILVVGSSDYAGTDLDLQYAAKDARDMAGALEQIGKPLIVPGGGQVTVQLLTTDGPTLPTKTAIKVAFDTINARSKAEDIVIVYFSGHGITYGDADRALFYYLTRDIGSFDLSDAGIREKRAISSSELTQWLKGIPALKQVLILDACNSGKVVEDIAAGKKALSASQMRALDRLKDRTGMFVLAGSAANKVSYEAGQYGQGVLTYSLLQGMNGMAIMEDNTVDVMKLFQDACDKVPELAKNIGGIQTPMLVGPLKGSFPIGIKDGSVHIKIANPKPVFIRNSFQDQTVYADVLGLTDALENYFRELTVKGAEADLVFVDVKAYEDAYSIKGRYKIRGENVVLHGRLFKGKTMVGDEFKVSGKTSDLSGLTEAIIDRVLELVTK